MEIGDAVNVRSYSPGSKWVPGTIIQESGPLSVRVDLEDGTVVRRHHDQLVSRQADVLPSGAAVPSANNFKQESLVSEVLVPDVNSPAVTLGDSESPATSGDPDLCPTTLVRRYPVRDLKPPQRFYCWIPSFPHLFFCSRLFLVCLRTWGEEYGVLGLVRLSRD